MPGMSGIERVDAVVEFTGIVVVMEIPLRLVGRWSKAARGVFGRGPGCFGVKPSSSSEFEDGDLQSGNRQRGPRVL